MVDWATQDRLYPPGYRPVDHRTRRFSIDATLPFSKANTKRHNCRLDVKPKKPNEFHFAHKRHAFQKAAEFYEQISAEDQEDKTPKLLATYTSKIHWPRSICCLSETDGSLIVCQQERNLLLLFTSQLMLRSTCGGRRGSGLYEFDSPWNVAALFDKGSSNILVADTNNRRVQHFTISFNGRFQHRQTFDVQEKPFYVATSHQYFAVSCERALILCYLAKEKTLIKQIDLNKTSHIKNGFSQAFPLCMDPETGFLFLADLTSSIGHVLQLTIAGEYLRSIKLNRHPFIHISSLIFDSTGQQLLLVDSSNSLICSYDHDLDDDNLEVLFKSSDHLFTPQSICVANEGHLVVVECSVTSEHALKIFRHHPCLCHTRTTSASVKTSENTSVRSMYFPYDLK